VDLSKNKIQIFYNCIFLLLKRIEKRCIKLSLDVKIQMSDQFLEQLYLLHNIHIQIAKLVENIFCSIYKFWQNVSKNVIETTNDLRLIAKTKVYS